MRRRSLALEPLESRCLMSATVMEHGDIGYFLNASADRVERYDILNEQWLAPVDLEGDIGTPTVLNVDDDGLYVAYDKVAYRFKPDGTGRTHLLNAQYRIQAIHTDGNLLFLNHTYGNYARLISINKTTNTVIDTIEDYGDTIFGSSIATDVNRIFGRRLYTSPTDITYLTYDDRGNLADQVGSSMYHGHYPTASQTWVFPDGTKVVDDSGTVYLTGGLTWSNSLGSRVDDLDFLGSDFPVILSGNTLTIYSPGLLPAGSITLGHRPTNIFVSDTSVITFTPDTSLESGFRPDVVPLSEFQPAMPGQAVDPTGLAYIPDKLEVTADGVVLLFSKSQQSIFRWDPASQSYLTTIPLVGAPEYMAYSAETNTVYLAYATGLIRKIDLGAPAPVESPFTILPARPTGLSTAGKYLFAVDPSGYGPTHYTFGPDGTLVDSVDWSEYSREFVWSDANQKMYFFRDGISPNDLHWEEIDATGSAYASEPPGGIGNIRESPLHTSDGFLHPIRVAPDGSVVVLGSGVIHDAQTLARNTLALANAITDATWLEGELYTVRNIAGVVQYQHWALPTYEMDRVLQVPGTAHALLTVPGNRLLGITLDSQGVPAFTVMDRNFSVVPPNTPILLAGDVSVAEGDAGVTSLTFEVALSQASDQEVTVEFTTTDGTAIAGSDYEAASGTLTFAPGETVKTITVAVRADATVERDETFSINLSSPANATTGRDVITGTIANDDRATLAIDGVTAVEGDSETTEFLFTVTLDRDVDSPVSISYSTVNGTATTADGDFTAAAGKLEFSGAAGETKTIAVPVNGDLKAETNETFSVVLTGLQAAGRNVAVARARAAGTITNDDHGAQLLPDGTLLVTGSDTRDDVIAMSVDSRGRIRMVYDGQPSVLFSGVRRIVVHGEGGNDTVTVGAAVPVPAFLYGGDGDDILSGGLGPDVMSGGVGSDVLRGGRGNDRLYGGEGDDVLYGDWGIDMLVGDAGNDLLIGGLHKDKLRGGAGDDILIGGTTTYDDNAAALAAIMSEWTSGGWFKVRTRRLDAGLDAPTAGLVRLKRSVTAGDGLTVLDDSVRDVLYGNQGNDWFLHFADKVADAAAVDRT